MEEHPNAFTYQNAYVQQTDRLRQNRELVAGQLGAGLTEEQIHALTTVTGTRQIPVLLGKYSNSGVNPITRRRCSRNYSPDRGHRTER